MNDPDLIVFPVPIRPDLCAKVQLPHDLTKEEAEKIARVVMALRMESDDA